MEVIVAAIFSLSVTEGGAMVQFKARGWSTIKAAPPTELAPGSDALGKEVVASDIDGSPILTISHSAAMDIKDPTVIHVSECAMAH